MHEPVLAPWGPFYTVTGSSAAALIGLTFVVITLIGDGARRGNVTSSGVSVFTTPTVVHFGSALLISAAFCAPWHTLEGPAFVLFFVGVVGIAYVARALYHSQKMTGQYEPDWEDWTWYTIVPAIAYLVMTIAALTLVPLAQPIEFLAASTVTLLLVIGIRNSWDIVTYLAVAKPEQERNV